VTGRLTRSLLEALAVSAADRVELWRAIVQASGVGTFAEVGVYRGVFAEALLDGCPSIDTYYLIDPWRHLDDWNKPANRDDEGFRRIHAEALRRTEAHASRRVVLRGRTVEVAADLPDGSLDAIYVDGDHTLRGIVTDLVALRPKLRPGGWIGGDDFRRSIWQHGGQFEPTLVFPVAVHVAEAMGVPVYALPHRQFLIHDAPQDGHRFVDLAGGYDRTALLDHVRPRRTP
jgi:hypothetical protein